MTTGSRLSRGDRLLSISEPALNLAARHSRESLPAEVGGVLVGWREEPNIIVVHELLLVPDDNPVRNRYDRHHQPADEALKTYLAEADDTRLGYVGEWHSHPAYQPPSNMDLRTIRRIARDLSAPVALLVLMAHRGGSSIEPIAVVASRTPHRTRVRDAHISTH